MVPVMIMGTLVGGKKYSMVEYGCVGLIAGGVSLFASQASLAQIYPFAYLVDGRFVAFDPMTCILSSAHAPNILLSTCLAVYLPLLKNLLVPRYRA